MSYRRRHYNRGGYKLMRVRAVFSAPPAVAEKVWDDSGNWDDTEIWDE